MLAALGATAFVAMLVDAIVGGGGLILLPAVLLAGLPPQLALGTNKVAGIAGTTTATLTFAAAGRIRWPLVAAAALAAFVGAALGAHVVLGVDPRALRVIVSVLLIAASLAAALNPGLGLLPNPNAPARSIWRSGAIGLGVGFYDGFFGPGTGTFMIFLFVAWLGLDFLHASGAAKFANFASNLAAVIVFALARSIDAGLALVLAVGAVAGAFVGSRLAIARGAGFVRWIFLAMVWALAARLVWQAFHS